MEQFNRLFDFVDTYEKRFPTVKMLNAKVDGNWQGYTASEIKEKSYQLAAALNNLGLRCNDNSVEAKDKVGIISNNRPEWIIADLAIQYCGLVSVPLYPTITLEEWKYILLDANVQYLFVSDAAMYKKILSIKAELPQLKNIYTFNEMEGATHWSTLLKPISDTEKTAIDSIKNTVLPEHLFTIIYTSGTTGLPKGVMLSHQNIASNVQNSMPLFHFCDDNSTALSFLPLNHIFERMVTYLYICKGIKIYYAQGMETIGDDLREVKPTLFTTVPRLLEKVYEKIEAKGASLTGIKKKLFDWAITLGERYDVRHSNGAWYNLKLKIADKLIFSKWRAAIGGNVKAIITGSAACQVKLLKMFTAANMVVMEGFGLSETSPVVSVNSYQEAGRKFGTTGCGLNNQLIKIAEDGEILCKGKHIMMGYYKLPEQTAEAIKDGWFHTGDIGVLEDGKYLKITDRKKELFKLSAGKYIAPQVIENKIKESALIEQIMVVGSNEKFVGALIVPNIQIIKEHFALLGKNFTDKIQVVEDTDVLKLIRAELNKYNKLFSEHEHVKRFQLLPEEWTIDTGELTPTMKLKRKVVMEKHQTAISKIFNN
jgi:long-chain acyl-CoA synthetase